MCVMLLPNLIPLIQLIDFHLRIEIGGICIKLLSSSTATRERERERSEMRASDDALSSALFFELQP